MRKWEKTITIKDLLTDNDDSEAIKLAADGITARLAGTHAPTSRLIKAKEMADTDTETALLIFNDGLNRIYDWADDNRVWLA